MAIINIKCVVIYILNSIFSVGFSSICNVRKSEQKMKIIKKIIFGSHFGFCRHFGFLFGNEKVSDQFVIRIYTFMINCIFLEQIVIKLWADSRSSHFRLYFSAVYPKYKHFARADFWGLWLCYKGHLKYCTHQNYIIYTVICLWRSFIHLLL